MASLSEPLGLYTVDRVKGFGYRKYKRPFPPESSPLNHHFVFSLIVLSSNVQSLNIRGDNYPDTGGLRGFLYLTNVRNWPKADPIFT